MGFEVLTMYARQWLLILLFLGFERETGVCLYSAYICNGPYFYICFQFDTIGGLKTRTNLLSDYKCSSFPGKKELSWLSSVADFEVLCMD